MSEAVTARQRTSAEVLGVYLDALVGRERSGVLEVRWRHGDGMRRRVYRVADELVDAGAAIMELGARTDVYVGCAPRCRRAGGRDAVARVWVLWVDCDRPAASAALDAFRPAPAIVVRSGSGQNRHAYWTLTGSLSVHEATQANRRLAHALGACASALTSGAAILRPPGTSNFKHDPRGARRRRAIAAAAARQRAGARSCPPGPARAACVSRRPARPWPGAGRRPAAPGGAGGLRAGADRARAWSQRQGLLPVSRRGPHALAARLPAPRGRLVLLRLLARIPKLWFSGG